MAIKLSKGKERQLIKSIKRYFEENLDEEIGDLKASLFLEFCLQEICPSVYNQAIKHSLNFMEDKLSELEDACYEIEFDYWEN